MDTNNPLPPEQRQAEKHVSFKDRINVHRGAGYGAMVGAIAGAIVMGPLAPLGAIIGGAVGGGIGSLIDQKFRRKRSDT